MENSGEGGGAGEGMEGIKSDEEMGPEEEEEKKEGGPTPQKGEKDDLSPPVIRTGIRVRDDKSMSDSELLRAENVTLVTPRRQYVGTLVLTRSYLYFLRSFEPPPGEATSSTGGGKAVGFSAGTKEEDGAAGGEEGEEDLFARRRWALKNVCGIYMRRYRLRDTSMEILLRRGRSRALFVDFGRRKEDNQMRDLFTRRMVPLVPRSAWKQWPRMAPDHLLKSHSVTQAWQRREISNYDYLMALNTIGGRSFNDLCQYPVFPWVLSNYTDSTIDLRDPKNFRDLTKPMGALNDDRLAEIMDRYESFSDPMIPKFMYGSHYSTAAGVVLHYLVRLQPFADLHKDMQSGGFDVADRLFSSIPRSWRTCTSELSEVKELTPEWYTLPDFLRNLNNFDMGETQDGVKVGNVELPPWAKTPEDFIKMQREALESEYVSENLHNWIDLIFGYKQKGPAAVKARNVFFYLTYYGAVDVSSIEDEGLRHATELQIAHFGQCPIQLFTRPHPPRSSGSVIHRPLKYALRTGVQLNVPVLSAQQSGGTANMPEPVYIQDVDNHLVFVKTLRNRILTINEAGVVNSYTWSCPMRNVDMKHAGGSGEMPSPNLAPNECMSPNFFADPSSRGSVEAMVGGGSFFETPSEGESEDRGRQDGKGSNANPRDIKPQILRLQLEQDLCPIENVPRVPPPTLTELTVGGGAPAGGRLFFPLHISRSGRFIFGGGEPFGSMHVLEIELQSGHVIGEVTVLGHTAPITCISSAGLEGEGLELLLTGSMDCTAMIWRIDRLLAKTKKPKLMKRPERILYGHSSRIVCCCLNYPLGIVLTCSSTEALIHSIEHPELLRRITLDDEDVAAGYTFKTCEVTELGYFVVSLQSSSAAQPSRVQVWSVNGHLVADRDMPSDVIQIMIVGKQDVVLVVTSGGLMEYLDIFELTVIGSYDLDLGQGMNTLQCVDVGPDARTPILMVCGTNTGSLVVIGLPLIHHLREFDAASFFSNSILNVPFKLVNNIGNMALKVREGRGGGVLILPFIMMLLLGFYYESQNELCHFSDIFV